MQLMRKLIHKAQENTVQARAMIIAMQCARKEASRTNGGTGGALFSHNGKPMSSSAFGRMCTEALRACNTPGVGQNATAYSARYGAVDMFVNSNISADEAAGIAQYMGHSLSTWAKYYDLSAKQRQRSKADKVLAAALAKVEWDGAGEVEEEAEAPEDDSSDGESGLEAVSEGAAQLGEAEAGEAEADGVHSHLFKITPSPVAHDSGAGILPDDHRGEEMEGDGAFAEDLQPWGQLFSTEQHEEDEEPPWLAGLMNRKAVTVLKRTRKAEQDCGFEPQRRRIPKLVLQQGRTYLSKPQCRAILTKPLLLAAMEQLFVWPLDQDGAAVGVPKKWNVIKLRKALHTGDDGASQNFE